MFPFGCAGMTTFIIDNQFLSNACHWHPTLLSHSLPSFLATLKTGLRASHMRGKCSRAELQPSSSFLQRIIINSECCFTLQLGMFFKDSHNGKREGFTRVCFCERDSLTCFGGFDAHALFCPAPVFVATLEASRRGAGSTDTDRSA